MSTSDILIKTFTLQLRMLICWPFLFLSLSLSLSFSSLLFFFSIHSVLIFKTISLKHKIGLKGLLIEGEREKKRDRARKREQKKMKLNKRGVDHTPLLFFRVHVLHLAQEEQKEKEHIKSRGS